MLQNLPFLCIQNLHLHNRICTIAPIRHVVSIFPPNNYLHKHDIETRYRQSPGPECGVIRRQRLRNSFLFVSLSLSLFLALTRAFFRHRSHLHATRGHFLQQSPALKNINGGKVFLS
jgi:hypothetical protein